MEMLLDDATDTPQVGKWYYFEYDPKFKDQLGEWDEFPLVKAACLVDAFWLRSAVCCAKFG